jgi:hypothetical protein
MEWIIFSLILGTAILAFPAMLRATKSSGAKTGVGSVVLALGMAFKAAIENLEKENENGKANKNAASDPKN